MQIFYAIRFFKIMIKKDFFDKNNEGRLIEKIAPLMLYPHNWIRNEAI
jgi:hypothetical protein